MRNLDSIKVNKYVFKAYVTITLLILFFMKIDFDRIDLWMDKSKSITGPWQLNSFSTQSCVSSSWATYV